MGRISQHRGASPINCALILLQPMTYHHMVHDSLLSLTVADCPIAPRVPSTRSPQFFLRFNHPKENGKKEKKKRKEKSEISDSQREAETVSWPYSWGKGGLAPFRVQTTNHSPPESLITKSKTQKPIHNNKNYSKPPVLFFSIAPNYPPFSCFSSAQLFKVQTASHFVLPNLPLSLSPSLETRKVIFKASET